MLPRRSIRLTREQRSRCHALHNDPRVPDRTRRRALVLLHADTGDVDLPPTDAEIAAAARVAPRTVVRTRAAFLDHGFEHALCVTPPRRRPAAKLSPEHEALLLQLAATPPPPGYPQWTTRTLAEHFNRRYDAPTVSRELVRRLLLRKGAPPDAGR